MPSDLGEASNIADLLTRNQLLDQLALLDPRAAEVLQLTYFGGLQRDEIATVLDLSVPTIDRALRFTRLVVGAVAARARGLTGHDRHQVDGVPQRSSVRPGVAGERPGDPIGMAPPGDVTPPIQGGVETRR